LLTQTYGAEKAAEVLARCTVVKSWDAGGAAGFGVTCEDEQGNFTGIWEIYEETAITD